MTGMKKNPLVLATMIITGVTTCLGQSWPLLASKFSLGSFRNLHVTIILDVDDVQEGEVIQLLEDLNAGRYHIVIKQCPHFSVELLQIHIVATTLGDGVAQLIVGLDLMSMRILLSLVMSRDADLPTCLNPPRVVTLTKGS